MNKIKPILIALTILILVGGLFVLDNQPKEAEAADSPQTELPFFIESHGGHRDDGPGGEIGNLGPPELNDYGDSAQKCDQWKCLGWLNIGAFNPYTDYYCAGYWDCQAWNGDVCKKWNCNSWAYQSTQCAQMYCAGYWDCQSWNGNVCGRWGCTYWAAAPQYYEKYCNYWDCQSWNGSACDQWKCTDWRQVDMSTINYYYYCLGGWDCQAWNGSVCDQWKCSSWTISPGYFGYYCSGNLDCIAWNGSVCDQWKCSSWTSPGTVDYHCTGVWDCQNWTTAGVCSQWKCTAWSGGGQHEWICSSGWECQSWYTLGYSLTVSKAGTGSGTVTDTGINCGTDCSETYDAGTPVTLTANPEAGSIFAGWSGDCTGTGACELTMNANKSVTATFNAVSYPTVTTDFATISTTQLQNNRATLKGNITSTGGQNADLRGFEWGTSTGSYPNSWAQGTSGNYQYGTGAFSYNLTGLTPGTIYYYRAKAHNSAGWGYGNERKVVIYEVSGGQKQFTTLVFPYTLTVSKAGTGSGTVTDTGINCGTDCSETYDAGTPVTLTATPEAGSIFAGWSGDCTGTGSCALTMDSDKNVTATFNLSDATPPAVWVAGAPANWQNTDAEASVGCDDGAEGSGCDIESYRLKTSTSAGSCSTTYSEYTLTSPRTISSHLWVCAAAKDSAASPNTGFSPDRVEFKIEKEMPVSQITSPEAGSTQTADFLVSVSDTDTGGSGIDTGACHYRTYDSSLGWTRGWTLRTCNSTQLITVGSGKDCQTVGGTCTVYVYSYDNAGNQSDLNLRGFEIESISCSVSVPTTGLVNQWVEINVSGSQGTISGVRFASDDNLNGTSEGSWDPSSPNYYDWNASSGNWNAGRKTMKWSFASADNYEVWAEVKDPPTSCFDTILIMECYPGQTTTCTSPQGCSHTITCRANGTWPDCPVDSCTADTQNTIACPCPGIDGCVGNDYYDYPAYGDCNSSCGCETGTSPGQPCAPTIYTDDSRCVDQDQCDSDAECEDGNPCTNNWCERPADPDSVCHRDNSAEGVSCGTCKQCDGSGNCVNRADGYDTGECGTGCQRCLSGSCQDYSLVCEGTVSSCECVADECQSCSIYDGCGYQGLCHCGPLEKPVWSCSDWKCQCFCQYDESCEQPGECERDSPRVVLSPASKSGDPGDTLTYDVSVQNWDLNCDPATFDLTSACPTDWPECELGSGSLTIEAGKSDSTTLSVTSPSDIFGGDYDVSVTATNSGAGLGTYFGTGYAIYQVNNQSPVKPGIPTEYLTWDHCSVRALSIPTFYWIYSDPEGDDQAGYQIRIDDDSDFSSPEPEEFTDSKDSSSHSYTPSTVSWRDWMDWDADYWWIVKVKDNQGNWSDWSDPTQFTTPLHAGPWPDFTPSPNRVSLDQTVTFEDNSKCYTSPGNAEFNCRDLSLPSYQWDFDYIEPTFTVDATAKGSVTTSYGEIGNYKIKLRITDDIDTCDSEGENLTVTLPLPEWREIAPF